MIDYNRLRDNLVQLFVSAEYEQRNPINFFADTAADITARKDNAVKLYQNDPIFHSRVEGLAARVIDIFDHCNIKED